MSQNTTVLLLGGTGRTGRRVLEQLLQRGAGVRAVVRSADRLPAGVVGHPGLTVIEAEVLSLAGEPLRELVRGCDAVVSCLGHPTTIAGIFGQPHELVTPVTEAVCRAITDLAPATPVRFVLMSSVSVTRPGRVDARRGAFERATVAVLRSLVPPARDNQAAADFLCREVGHADPHVQWVVVRPDSLVEGEVSEYALHEGLVSSLARPDRTAMSNVAHFMCELVTDPATWGSWRGQLPVIVNAGS